MNTIKYFLFVFLFLSLLSCSDNTRINRESLAKIKTCMVMTYYHEISIPQYGSIYFQELIKRMINTPGGYQGYPLLRDGIDFFLTAAREKYNRITWSTLPSVHSLPDLSLYRKPNQTGKYYFNSGERKIVLPTEGRLSETDSQKVIQFLAQNNNDAAIAVKLFIEITFKHPFDNSDNSTEPGIRFNPTQTFDSPAFDLRIRLVARMLDKNLSELLFFKRTKAAGYPLFNPEKGMNLGIRSLLDEFFAFLNNRN